MAGKRSSEPKWVRPFLAALRQTGNAPAAARAQGIVPGTAHYRRKHHRKFADEWQAALKAARRGAVAACAPGEPWGKRTAFLEALAETSNVTASAMRANMPTQTVYKLRREDKRFAAQWREALFEGYDHLEMEVLCYLRDPQPERKMDVPGATKLLAAHRETVERERALREDDDEQEVFDSIDRFIDRMRVRRAANTAILDQVDGDGAQ
jgi:hypothetical protein